MAPPKELEYGMPGLRVRAVHDFRTYHITHLPTHANLILAKSPDYESAGKIQARGLPARQWTGDVYAGLNTPLAPAERAALDAIPAMTAQIETLLAGLVARLHTRDPAGNWATGNWWNDPLHRPAPPGNRWMCRMSLWGEGSRWVLRWNGHPYPEDIVACLTAPDIGIVGAVAIHEPLGWKITLGGSSLLLRYGSLDDAE